MASYSSPVFHLVYVSKAKQDLCYSDIQDILATSRKRNAELNITGLLIYRDNYFMQLLEGDEPSVRSLMSKIQLDTRHFDINIIVEEKGADRFYQSWSMAYCDGDIRANETTELLELFETALAVTTAKRDIIMPMLRKFKSSGAILQ